jgi:DNA-binding MarR family transcriptional regulator
MTNKTVSLSQFATELQQLMPILLGSTIRRERNAISQGIITLPQFLGLTFLRANPAAPVKAFAATLGVQLSTASGLLARLEKLDLLRREHSTEDRRVVHLFLTTKGEEMLDEINAQRRDSFARLFAALSPDERTLYLQLMKKLAKNLHEI